MEKQETEMKWKLETEIENKWKNNFATVVQARFNCCYPSALPASTFCFASLALFNTFRCPSCSVMCDCCKSFVYVLSSILSLVFITS